MSNLSPGDLVEVVSGGHGIRWRHDGRCPCGCGVAIGMRGVVTSAQFGIDGLHGHLVRFPVRTILAQTRCLKKIQGPPPDDEELIFEGSKPWSLAENPFR